MQVSCFNNRFPFQPQYSLHHHQDSSLQEANPAVVTFDMTKEKIRKLFNNVELSVSSYDTAWVAMVPSPNSPDSPCFPDCLNWLMENQLNDGSWGGGLLHHHSSLPKDTLASTLACVVALKRWNAGEHQINRGLCFIDSNFASATDKNDQRSPFGFDIIFPRMFEYAKDLNIHFSLHQKDLMSVMLYKRDLEITRCNSQGREAYLAYISEGLGNYYDLKMVKKYQMKNGSVLNSPSATAALLIHHQNAGCLNYLRSLISKFGNAVPTVYPFDIYARLCMVDKLQSLGISRHFRVEIQNVLDETYRCWVKGDEQIFMDIVTCALAFRVLRTNGYEVSSDRLAEITKQPFDDVYAAVQMCNASQIMHQEELAFGEAKDFLDQTILNASIFSLFRAPRFPFNASVERISTRRNIEHYNVDTTRTLKTTFRSSNISNTDYIRLAVEDFNACQSIHRVELEGLERWVVENRLDKLKFVRQRAAYCYFSVASTLSTPELSDARISWTKSSILTGVIDDFFDVGGSMDELVNLIQCVEKWHVNVDNDCCSNEVRIIFLALKDAVIWIGEEAYKRQNRSVTNHVIETWLNLMQSMLREAIWSRDKSVPTMNEYMENGYVSVALGPIVLPALYFVGPKLSKDVVESSEYYNLFKLMSTQGRILNDIQSYKRELEAGKLNAVTLHTSDEQEAVEEMKKMINSKRGQLLKLVVQVEGSVVPRACKDVFWSTSNVLNLFYATEDGFTGNSILDTVKEVIYRPVSPTQKLYVK
ncbi:unnamed protein product [Lactuca saligna]|uniref:Ent-kaurene synthase n=1 Tax=Lactuca saligna TaxID=75948 RepID=A0AA36EC97_LACSI|nr:unnamed protein product [Lactuca saligna]